MNPEQRWTTPATRPEADDGNRDSRQRPPPEEVTVCILERSLSTQIRITLVRFVGRREALVGVQEWRRRDRLENEGEEHDGWKPIGARSLIRGCEISLIVHGMWNAVDRARDLGWEVRV